MKVTFPDRPAKAHFDVASNFSKSFDIEYNISQIFEILGTLPQLNLLSDVAASANFSIL
jgi:hypothetical protein